jgi:hypothetical protein
MYRLSLTKVWVFICDPRLEGGQISLVLEDGNYISPIVVEFDIGMQNDRQYVPRGGE